MTRRQANLILAGIVALILCQLLCTMVILRGQELTRKEAEAAQVSAVDTLEMQKQAAGRPSTLGVSGEGASFIAAGGGVVRGNK